MTKKGVQKMRGGKTMYPTIEEVDKATHEQICRWHRFLPSPETRQEAVVNTKIYERFVKLGITSKMSKKIGWEPCGS